MIRVQNRLLRFVKMPITEARMYVPATCEIDKRNFKCVFLKPLLFFFFNWLPRYFKIQLTNSLHTWRESSIGMLLAQEQVFFKLSSFTTSFNVLNTKES